MKTLRRMKIEVYGHDECPYCLQAKSLLQDKGWNYIYYNIKECPDRSTELSNRLRMFGVMKRLTVPQIFVNDENIGGYTDLVEYVMSMDNGRMI